MLSVKRLCYVIVLVLIVSAVFMIYNINEERSKSVKTENITVEEEPLTGKIEIDVEGQTGFYVIGDEEKEIYKDIFKNTVNILKDMHLTVKTMSQVPKEMPGLNTVLVFCGEDVSSRVDMLSLGKFISDGGKVVFAAGLAEGDVDSYLYPYIGITEKTMKDNCQMLRFEGDLLPLQFDTAAYDRYNSSTWISLREDAEVYISDEDKKIPLLYSYGFQKGSSVVINGTFLSDIRCCGLLTGSLGVVMGEFLYPIMGTKSVFLDNFPMVTYVDDKVCMELYGRTTESFVRDVIWPKFQGMSLRTNTRFTSGVLIEASDIKAFPEINDSLFTTIGKSALQYEGELVYAANCEDAGKIYLNEEFIKEFEAVFQNYEIQGLTLMSEEFSEEMLDITHDGIQALRGYLGKDTSFQYNEDYYTLPGATFGNDMEDGNLFAISSVLGAYGMVSHVFDVNSLVIGHSPDAAWDIDKKQIGKFESEILSNVSYLEAATLTETRNRVNSYVNMNYGWEKEGERLKITCSNIISGQKFFYRTEKKIASAQGLTYIEIGNGYYLLTMNENEALITLEER